jgi:flavorubredoxin
MTQEARPIPKAIVLFTSRYGNTEKIAKALAAGLNDAGVETTTGGTGGAEGFAVDSLTGYDLICLGAPTEWLSAPKPMKEFLTRLGRVTLAGKSGFAFDTRFDRPLSGSAAKFIEKELKSMGLRVVAPRESATVLVNSKAGHAVLKEGEVERFMQIGVTLGRTFVTRSATS